MAVVASVGVVRLSWNVMFCPAEVLLNTTLVSALTADAKVAPLLFVSVSVLRDVVWPKVLVTLTVPALVAFNVNDCVLAVVPLTAPLIFKAPPEVLSTTSSVRVKSVAEPAVASPKLITPAPLVLICPAALMLLGAIAVKPPAKVKLSVALLPKVKMPVLLNTVAACVSLMLVLLPCKARL